MAFTRPPTSKSFSPFNNPLVTPLKAPITIDIIVTFMFLSFFNSLASSRHLSFFSFPSVLFYGRWVQKSEQFIIIIIIIIIIIYSLDFFT